MNAGWFFRASKTVLDNSGTFEFTVYKGSLSTKEYVAAPSPCGMCEKSICDSDTTTSGVRVRYWNKGRILIKKAGEGEFQKRKHKQIVMELQKMADAFGISSPTKKGSSSDTSKTVEGGTGSGASDPVAVECIGCGKLFCDDCEADPENDTHKIICEGCYVPMCMDCCGKTDFFLMNDFLTWWEPGKRYTGNCENCGEGEMLCKRGGCHDNEYCHGRDNLCETCWEEERTYDY